MDRVLQLHRSNVPDCGKAPVVSFFRLWLISEMDGSPFFQPLNSHSVVTVSYPRISVDVGLSWGLAPGERGRGERGREGWGGVWLRKRMRCTCQVCLLFPLLPGMFQQLSLLPMLADL